MAVADKPPATAGTTPSTTAPGTPRAGPTPSTTAPGTPRTVGVDEPERENTRLSQSVASSGLHTLRSFASLRWHAPMAADPSGPLDPVAALEQHYPKQPPLRAALSRNRRSKIFGVLERGVEIEPEAYGDTQPAAETLLPSEAYSAVCVPCCAPKDLPCADSKAVQALFSNSADVSKRKHEQAEGGGEEEEPLRSGTMLGLPDLEAAGWVFMPELPETHDMHLHGKEAEHEDKFRRCHRLSHTLLGLYRVLPAKGAPVEHLAISFPKDQAPGNASSAKALIRKLRDLDHVNIVKLVEACEDEDAVHLIYEACDGSGTLPTRIITMDLLSQGEGARLLQQLAAGIAAAARAQLHLLQWTLWHVMSPMEGALTPAKLFGVGLAGVLHSGTLPGSAPPSSPQLGAYYYSAPSLSLLRASGRNAYEALDSRQRVPSDIWSIAAVVVAGYCGHPPYRGATEETVVSQMHSPPPGLGADMPEVHIEGVSLLERALQRDWTGRPNCADILDDSWVASEALRCGGHLNINSTIDTLQGFAESSKAKRTIGKLLMQVLRPERQRSVEDLFRGIDVRGNAEIGLKALAALAGDRRREVFDIFELIDDDGSGTISFEEFNLANVFSEEVLTERMLEEVFCQMDINCNNSISPTEVFQALRFVNDSLLPADICELITDADSDWDMNMDFAKFRGYFKQVRSTQGVHNDRRDCAEKKIDLNAQVSKSLLQDIEQWLEELRDIDARISRDFRVLQIDAANGKSGQETVKKVKKISEHFLKDVKRARQLVRSPPSMKLPERAEAILGGRRRMKQMAADAAHSEAEGVYALDIFMHRRKAIWLHDVDGFVTQVALVQSNLVLDGPVYSRMSVLDLMTEVTTCLGTIISWVDLNASEQADIMDAATHCEGGCPATPFANRGLPPVRALDVQELVEEHKRARGGDANSIETLSKQKAQRKKAAATLRSAITTCGPRVHGALPSCMPRNCEAR